MIDITIKFKEQEEGQIFMCELLEQTIKEREQITKKEGIEEGIRKGREEGSVKTFIEACVEFGVTENSEILKRIFQKFPNLSQDKAVKYFKKFKI